MRGSRSLSDSEVAMVLQALSTGPFKLRNRALFLLGLKSGFRIRELLSLTVGDVFQNGHFVSRVSVQRRHMKKKTEGRTVVLHPEAKQALIAWVEFKFHNKPLSTPLFLSRKGNPMARGSAWLMLTNAYRKCGLTGKLGTHAMRKTFAHKVHDKLGKDILKTQKALGHRSINSTVSYLSFDDQEIDDAILKA